MQRKTRFPMIEHGVGPIGRYMTRFAFATVTPLVVVLAQVAARTRARQTVFEVFACMTILTVESAVAVLEGEAGFAKMIEADASPRCR